MSYPQWPEGPADQLERELLARWKTEDLFRQTLERNRDGRPFVFYEGPPTANGMPTPMVPNAPELMRCRGLEVGMDWRT